MGDHRAADDSAASGVGLPVDASVLVARPSDGAQTVPPLDEFDQSDLALAPRGLVPSRREQGLGVEVGEYKFTWAHESPPRKSARAAVAEWARTADPRAIEGAKLPLVLISAVSFFAGLDAAAVVILLPEIQAAFGLDLSFLIGFAVVTNTMLLVFGLPMGYLADRIKRVWMVRFGAVVGGLAGLLVPVFPTVGVLVGARLLGGFGGAVSGPASYPLLTDYFPARARARVFALFGIAAALGAILGPAVGGQLAARVGWRGTLFVVGVIGVVLSAFTFLLKEPRRGYWDRLDMGATEAQAATEQAPVSFGEGYRAATSITTLRRLWYATPFLVVVAQAQSVYLPLYYAGVFQIGPAERGVLGSVGAMVGVAGLAFAGPVGDRLLAVKPGRVFSLVGALMVLGAANLVVLAVSPSLWLSFGAALPLGFVGAMIAPTLATLSSIVIPARVRGLGLQAGVPFSLMGQVLTVLTVSLFAGAGLRGAFLVMVPFSLIAAIIVTSAGPGVERDIRAGAAASMADEEAARAKAAGRNKMVVCRDVDVAYDGVEVLFSVDFDVEEGDVIALLGTNGAGKSTLLRAIAGVQEASNGAIFLDGNDITHVPPHENAAKGVVMMPGGNAVFPTLTVDENLRTAAWMYRGDEPYVAERMKQVLAMFPVLGERLAQPAGNLSGGEQQMVGLAQALLMKPRLLMIDELSLGLAPQVVEQLLGLLRTIHAQGTTVILVEQSLNVALTIAERAVFMEKGQIRFSGPTAELMQRPDLIRAVFMGGRATGATRSARRPAARRPASEPGRPLAVERIGVSFGGVHALRSVDLDVGDDEIVGIIGPNGAGKTTLFDVISGFVTPDTGRVLMGDQDVTKLTPDARARLGLARSFQNARLFGSLTVRENVAVALERRAVKSAVLAALWTATARKAERKIAGRVDDLVELLGLEAYADKFVSELSTGTRRAVDVACIMAAEPKLLLLDEPSSGLAQAETEELGPVLMRVARDAGCAMLVIEHDLPLISSISDRLLAMEAGATIVSGRPLDVVNHPQVLASYLAASEDVLARSDTAMTSIASAVGYDMPRRAGTASTTDPQTRTQSMSTEQRG